MDETLLERTQEIIDKAYNLLIRKIAFGGVIAKSERAFQYELGYILKTIGGLYEFDSKEKFSVEFEITLPPRGRTDILVSFSDGDVTIKVAIELKFFKASNHREPNNRYDVFNDLLRLENYKAHGVDLCYFLLSTDHNHYYDWPNYAPDTADFDFRHGKSYVAGTTLSYRTPTPYDVDIQLNNNYIFNWDAVNQLYFLKVKI